MDLPNEHIEYIHSIRAKNLRITIKAGPRIKVIIPRCGSMQRAKDFVRSKMRWIQKIIEQFAKEQPGGQTIPRQRHVVTKEMIERQGELFDRLKTLAVCHSFHYRNAAIRNQKTRWGSCSSQNNINLNIHLLNLPEHLRDYVMLHELVHTEHKNHSKRFWARLDEVVDGRSKELRKEMRQYRIGI